MFMDCIRQQTHKCAQYKLKNKGSYGDQKKFSTNWNAIQNYISTFFENKIKFLCLNFAAVVKTFAFM